MALADIMLRLLLFSLLWRTARPAQCGESQALNWTAVREDLITYATLAEPVMRSRRCFGLDQGVWSYCGIAAMRLLQMQPGLISNSQERDLQLAQMQNPCRLGQVAADLFSLSFLTPGERHGMLFVAGDRLNKLGMSFAELLRSGWPIFGLLARLSEVVLYSGQARPIDSQCAGPGAALPLLQLREELSQRVAERKVATEALARRILASLARLEPREQFPTQSPGCSMAAAAAWAAMAEAAALREDTDAESACLERAESLVRAVSTNYTILDWLSTQWPTFRILHRLQFGLLPEEAATVEGFWLQEDLVPEDPDTGGRMKFAFNKGFIRPDALYIDVAADIVGTDMLRTLPAFFGMRAARPGERWNVGLAYTSNDYGDLIPSKDLWRLRGTRQKLVFVPDLQEVIGEKDQQCRAYYDALDTWQVSDRLASEVGGMPKCFDMPGAAEELRAFASQTPKQGGPMAFVRKPEGAWGGRGIEIRFGVHHLLGADEVPEAAAACEFLPLEDAQCLGLEAGPEGSSATPATCSEACCGLGSACEAWNWRDPEGCWVGIPRFCTDSNPMYLGGWRGGKRPRGSPEGVLSSSAKQRAVVQQYILDPVLYQLEGVWPPVTVKTDIRIYGTVVSMDPFRFYISEYGYFRSGFLEKNYSASKDDDFQDALMHVTHHIPKIEAGTYQCPTAPSWGHPQGAEHDAGSGGSLHKWFKIAEEQNGLDPKVVWKNIKLALSIFLLGTRDKLDCASNAIPHACGSVGFHFFADLVVDRRGRAYLMEIHPTLAVKSPGLGDPEAGWVEVLTRSTRQGTVGSLAMSFIGWANAPYRRWVESLLRRHFRSKHRWRLELQGVARRLKRQRSTMPGWSGEAPSIIGLLSKVLVEEHLACRLAVVQVLPAMWSDVAAIVGPKPEGGDPFAGLHGFYRLLAAARRVIAGRTPDGDLRPKQCEAVDFNLGGVWDQPWERSSRRFQI